MALNHYLHHIRYITLVPLLADYSFSASFVALEIILNYDYIWYAPCSVKVNKTNIVIVTLCLLIT